MKVLIQSCCVFMLLYSALVKAETYYQIEINQPEHHLADVQMKFQVNAPGVVELKLPAWRTGKYQILDLANGVRLFQARDQKGRLLKFSKKDKSTWLLQLPIAGEVQVNYQIYANQLGERSRHIDETHGYINPSAYLMFSDELRTLPATVQLKVPAEWRSTSGLPKGDNPHQFKAVNYDVLADSPIETGLHQSFNFVVDNRSYEVVFWGEGNYDSKQIVADLQKLVKQLPTIWQGYPYQNYLFIIHATSGARGATEHLNSTVIQRDRFSFASRKHYLEFLGTAAHELVHTWNVKAYRPAELVPYDYLAPNYSELLWISEGSTSYFQNQLLLRAGLMTTAEFYEDLTKRLEKFFRLPGAKVQSVAQSSFDSWISMTGDHADNFSVNIYSEGYLVSWLLDQHLLRHSGLKANYRTLHNELYQRFASTTAFTATDVQQIALDLTGKHLTEFWQQQVESPLQLDTTALLADAGLEYKPAEKQQAWLGITSTFNAGVEKLSKVERDGPAWQAGFTSDDEVIAVNQLQLKSPLTERLKDFKPKEQLHITLFRQGRLLEKTVTLGALASEPGKIVPVKKPSRRQRQYHQAWLGVALPE